MLCFVVFKDARGRLPSAEDLRRYGFHVSTAALPAEPCNEAAPKPAAETPDAETNSWSAALAAETPAGYGRGQDPSPPPTPPAPFSKKREDAGGLSRRTAKAGASG